MRLGDGVAKRGKAVYNIQPMIELATRGGHQGPPASPLARAPEVGRGRTRWVQLGPTALVRRATVCATVLSGCLLAQPVAPAGWAVDSVLFAQAPDLDTLREVPVTYDPGHSRLTIELPVGNVAPGGATGMYMRTLPVAQAIIPATGTIYSIVTQVVDGAGHVLPRSLLHHVNLTDPTRRELFLPISLHIFAASKETPPVHVPSLMLGMPLTSGQRLLVMGMVGNQTPIAYQGVRFRVIIGYRPASRLWPLWRAYPWVLDAMYPLGTGADGSKAFDLPPGRTTRTWEGSPAVPGYILGIGGHVHDYAVSLDFTDVTTGQLIWHGVPQRDSAGRVLMLPVTTFFNWHRLGIHIEPHDRYRISVTYDNRTGHLLHNGGMGAVAGLFVPDKSAVWPPVDTANTVYRQDLQETFAPPSDDMDGMMMGAGNG